MVRNDTSKYTKWREARNWKLKCMPSKVSLNFLEKFRALWIRYCWMLKQWRTVQSSMTKVIDEVVWRRTWSLKSKKRSYFRPTRQLKTAITSKRLQSLDLSWLYSYIIPVNKWQKVLMEILFNCLVTLF